MTTHRYKSDAVIRDIIVKSAVIAFVAGLAVNIPVAIVMVATSAISGCYDREQYVRALALLPVIHLMVFILVFVLMVSMFILAQERTNGIDAGK
jgi:chromate transport protein ChrA